MLLPMSSILLSNFSHWKAKDVKLVFSGHIYLAVAINHNLVNSPLVTSFLCLANKWVIQKGSLIAGPFAFFIFVKIFCYDKKFYFKFF